MTLEKSGDPQAMGMETKKTEQILAATNLCSDEDIDLALTALALAALERPRVSLDRYCRHL